MPTSASSTASTELFARAKRDIDLPGFLAAHGWQGVPNHDSRFCRSLRGPDGSHLIVSRAPDGHWVWFRDGGGGGGSIVDAVGQLLGVSTWGGLLGVLRRALASPPPPLPVAVGSGRRTQSLTATADPMQTHTVIGPLSERGRAYLIKGRCLHPATVERFTRDLRENEMGSVRALHNAHEDGEERGPGWKSFVGGQHLGVGRGRSLWRARPSGAETPRLLLTAEAFLDALSAWETLEDDGQQRASLLASTAGSLSLAGLAKLEKLVAWMHRKALGKEIWLLDASDNGEADTERRLATLRELAERTGATYERLERCSIGFA